MITFQGVPLEELLIDDVIWLPEAVAHMRNRREAQGTFCPEPEWATEAALEQERLVALATPDVSIKVIGRSSSADEILKVWLQLSDIWTGEWHGQSAARANDTEQRRYKEASR